MSYAACLVELSNAATLCTNAVDEMALVVL